MTEIHLYLPAMPTPVSAYLIFPRQTQAPSIATPGRKLLFLAADMKLKTVDPQGVVEELGAGTPGAQGPEGPAGSQGPIGPTGSSGTAATIAVGTVTTVDPGDPATVINSGTSSAAVFDFDIPRGSPGKVVQVVYAESTASVSTATRIPYDNTIPQITEGLEILTCSITPMDAANFLLIRSKYNYFTGGAAASPCLCLFRDATADALDAVLQSHTSITQANGELISEIRVSAGSIAATTFRMRVAQDAGTLTVNPTYFGGVNRSTLTVTEISP